MKKITLWMFVSIACLFFLAACGGGGDSKTGSDEKIISITKIEDYGYVSLYEIVMDFSSLPAGTKVVNGQSAPNSVWIDYAVQDPGNLFITWTDGEFFEFTYCTENETGRTCVEPTGAYVYPANAPEGEQHFRVQLGETGYCPENNTGDVLVLAVHKLSANNYRIYLDFTRLPIVNYQKLFVKGQSGPDSAWIEYAVTDDYPCYYTDVTWPENSTLPFEFSYGVIKEDGKEEWIDPIPSIFLYKDRLAIDFRNYN